MARIVDVGEWLARAIEDGHATLQQAGKRTRINYVAVNHSELFDEPEEWVRADFWAELIYRYGYPPNRIAVEVSVPDRVPGDYADLVVCRDDGRLDPFAVIECKPDGVTNAVFEQAVEQAVGNGTWAKLRADYVMVVAGATRRVLDMKNFPVGERTLNVVADLPKKYSAPTEWKYRKGTNSDIQVVPREELISALKKCHQTLWDGGHMSPPAAFGELCKVIFVKLADEVAPRRKGEPYEFQIKSMEAPDGLALRLRTVYDEQRRKSPDVFNSDLTISATKFYALVEHLQGIDLSRTDVDVKGVAFELFMSSFFKGDSGQYFTPRELIEFCIELAEVKVNDVIIDPACGSSGFLLYALERIRQSAGEYYPVDSADHFALWHGFALNNLYGIEVNEEISRVAKMDMVLHGDGQTNVVCADALQAFNELSSINSRIQPDSFDLVLTNPPFGSSIKRTERPYLSDYELGNTWTKSMNPRKNPRKAQASEVIFIERVFQLLKPGTGRAVIILPDGILTNARTRYVREFILSRFDVQAIVSLPIEAFFHYGATVKASILMLRKLASDESNSGDGPVFLAEADSVGYDSTGRTTTNDLPSIIDLYREFRVQPSKYLVELPELTFNDMGETDDLEHEDAVE